MSDLIIRQGNADDLPAVHDLVRELAIYEKEAAAFTASLADYKSNFEANVFEYIVAEVKGEVVGMCLYYLTWSTWKGRMLYLEDFVVRGTLRRRGLGQQLFEALLERARVLDCKLAKWQVLDWNEPAIRFYEKNDAIIERNWWTAKVFLEETASPTEG